MKIAFLTESGFSGKYPNDFPNCRTEIAWQITLNSDHYNIWNFKDVRNYDAVFIIFPKGLLNLNMVGVELNKEKNWASDLFASNIVSTLKNHNKKVCYIQEGPAQLFNDYSVLDQFNFYNQLAECDLLFAHNQYDVHFYKGLFPQSKIDVIPTLMYEPRHINISSNVENKAIIGGNFAHWYSGFQSYITATEFECPIFVPASHCKRHGEEQVPNLKHLPWVMWNDWMKQLSTFKYAVNLMPTVAAGTFQMNCAFFGIPCIGNEKLDTQQRLFPELSVDVNDLHQARHLAIQLKEDKHFYDRIAYYAINELHKSVHFDKQKWTDHMIKALNE